jgi:hypothetical protein
MAKLNTIELLAEIEKLGDSVWDHHRLPRAREALRAAGTEIKQLRAVLQSTLCQLDAEKAFPVLQKQIRMTLGIKDGEVDLPKAS